MKPAKSTSAEPDEAAAVWIERATLKPWPRNPRHNAEAVEKVAASIKRFGFGNPILARKADNEIIAGHTRVLAAELLGIEFVPVRFLDLDPADAHLLAIADNKLGEIAEWDDKEVVTIMAEYSAEDAALAGFEDDELDKLAKQVAADDDDPPTVELDEHFAIIIDCTSEAQQLDLLGRFQAEGLKCRALI